MDPTYTPAAGDRIILSNILNWKEVISPARQTVEAAGVLYADPSQDEATRRAYLLAQRTVIQGANNAATGTLAFGGESRVFERRNFTARLPGDDKLEWTLSLSRKRNPITGH